MLANVEAFGRLDFETIAENMAQLVDQGRKALAAAIGGANPEEARSELAASVADATKTLGAVAEWWLSKPERAAAAQADLYGGLSEISPTSDSPRLNGTRTRSSIGCGNPICSRRAGPATWWRRPKALTRRPRRGPPFMRG
jgi:hypothetical protein